MHDEPRQPGTQRGQTHGGFAGSNRRATGGASWARAEEHLLDGLTDAQAQAVTSTAESLCLIAGAGSGKTRVVTRRIAHRVREGTADPARILAITFTRKASGELRSRLAALGIRDRVAIGTFHSIAYAQLRQWWDDTGQRTPDLATSKVRLISPLLARGPEGAKVAPIEVASEIEWAKARLLTPDTYLEAAESLGRRPPLGAAQFADLFDRYEREKRRRNVVDFDDLLLRAAQAMTEDREFAARQNWRFRHVFVDEFQDVNPAQDLLLDGWLRGGADLCVVGDPNQAIYGWNGADPRFLEELPKRRPGTVVLRLDDNFRSSPEILTVADAVLGLGARNSPPLRANRPNGPVPVIHMCASDLEEARVVAQLIHDRHAARLAWKHCAVLVRTNAQLVVFEEAFRAAGVPFRVRSDGPFLARPDVRSALNELVGRPNTVALAERLVDIEEQAAELRSVGPVGSTGTNDRADALEGLVRLGHEFLAAEADATAAGFSSWLAATMTSRADEPVASHDAVELTTFHRSKGLEWPFVVIAGLERGLVPIGTNDDPGSLDEERRLLYVAVTRAEQELHLSWARVRTFGSRTTNRTRSAWLDNVEAAVMSLSQAEAGDWRTVLRTMRERLAAAKTAGVPGARGTKAASVEVGTNADPKVFSALKKWRSAQARATGVPAFVIFHDTTLALVAEVRPTDREGLRVLAGVGEHKVDRYGDALLQVMAEALAG